MVNLKETVIGVLKNRLELQSAEVSGQKAAGSGQKAGALKNSAGASSTALKSRAVKKAAPKKKGGAGK